MDSKGFRKEVEKRKEVFKDFERGVLEDIVNGMVNNAGEVARTAAKELLESEITPPHTQTSSRLDSRRKGVRQSGIHNRSGSGRTIGGSGNRKGACNKIVEQ